MATRYTEEQKKEVVGFVEKYDREHGRGGQSAAKKQYNINPISIKKWCVEAGVVPPSKSSKKASLAKAGAKRGAKNVTKRPKAASAPEAATANFSGKVGSMTATLKKMSSISEKIESLQAEFDALKKSL